MGAGSSAAVAFLVAAFGVSAAVEPRAPPPPQAASDALPNNALRRRRNWRRGSLCMLYELR